MCNINIVSNDSYPILDIWSGRIFRGTVREVEIAVLNIQNQILRVDYATLNEFYDYLGISVIGMGQSYGWDNKEDVDVRFGAQTLPSFQAITSFWFRTEPHALTQ